MFEWTLSLNSLVTATSILLAGAAIYWKSYYDIKAFKMSLADFKDDLADLKLDVKVLNKLVTDMALQGQRLEMLERHIDELRHGRGYIK